MSILEVWESVASSEDRGGLASSEERTLSTLEAILSTLEGI